MLRILAILAVALPRGEGFFKEIPQMEPLPADGGDPGQPLFLTPYIEAGNLEEGRRLARVSFPELPSIESFSGFVTVNKTYDSNLFFWFFPIDKKPYKDHHVLRIYIQGFPGVSSMFGQFHENGPIQIVDANSTLKPKKASFQFTKYSSVLYIDHAVGAGFSFTNDSRGYCTSQEEIGDQLYSALFQIMKLFPDLQECKLLVHGELYAGKFAVSLARAISLRSQTSDVTMKLSQLIIGSGWCNPISQLLHYKKTYQTGLHDWRMVDYFKQFEYNTTQLIKQEKWLEASNYFTTGMDLMQTWSGDVSYLNFMNDISDYRKTPKFVRFVQTSPVRRVLHVGDLKFQDGVNVRNALKPDLMKSVAPWMSELVQQYRIILYHYNGAQGVLVPSRTSIEYLRKIDPYFAVIPLSFSFGDSSHDKDLYYCRASPSIRDSELINAGHLPALDDKHNNVYIYDFVP